MNIPAAEKLVHLQKLISDQTHEIITNLEATDKNYELAITELNRQYDKPHLAISELHSETDNLPQAADHPTSLKSTYFALEGKLTALRSHAQQVDDNPPLRNKILSKYPIDVVTQVCGKTLMNITEFQQAMQQYIAVRDSIQSAIASSGAAAASKPNKALTSALFSGADSSPKNPAQSSLSVSKKSAASSAFGRRVKRKFIPVCSVKPLIL